MLLEFVPSPMSSSVTSGFPLAEPQSILVFGSGESAMSMLAAGFAERVRPEFAWANCSGSTVTWERWVAEIMERGSEGRCTATVDPRELRASAIPTPVVRRLVVPESLPGELQERLVEFAGLPPLFQRLVSKFSAPEDPTSVVLTNADAFQSPLVESSLASARLHAALRRERITLSVTFRGHPTSTLKEAFDHVLRVDSPRGIPWVDARVMSERGFEATDLLLPQSLRAAWAILGLNPQLLPAGPPG